MAINIENAYYNCEWEGKSFISHKSERLIDFDQCQAPLELYKGEYYMSETQSDLGKAIKADCLIKQFPPDYSKLTAYSQLKNVKHPNMVSVENFYHKDGCPHFVLSWVDGSISAWINCGGAKKLLKSNVRGSIPAQTYQKMVVGICSAMETLLSKKIYPSQVTPENIFMKKTCKGLGTAKILVSEGDLPFIEQEIRAHPFFWDETAAKEFFISEIPFAVDNEAFRTKVFECDEKDLCVAIPWSGDGYFGFVKRMDDYRKNVLRLGAYDKKSKLDYVKFLSGLFVHEAVLKGRCSVHNAMRARNPEVFVRLFNMVPRPPRILPN